MNQQTYTGKVVSNKMNKTVVIEKTIMFKHPLYKKLIRRTRNFLAHSDTPIEIGTMVKLKPCRPLSKNKHFKVSEILK